MSRRITRPRTAHYRGSSTVEFSLMVAAMAAMILAVVLGVGRVVGSMLWDGCQQLSAHVATGGSDCVRPEAPGTGVANGGSGSTPAVDPAAQNAPADTPGDVPDDVPGDTQAPGPNDLGGSPGDM